MPLRRALPLHAVETAFERGWSTLTNGDLLSAAEDDGFEVFVTTDTNLRYQQNLGERKIAIVVLLTTSWPRIRAVAERVANAVDGTVAGGYVEVEIPLDGDELGG